MKVYAFYLKPTGDLKDTPIGQVEAKVKYALYAITPNKKTADLFTVTRDMTKFISKVWKVDKDEVDEFLIKNRGRLLSEIKFVGYRNKNTDNQTPYYVTALMTEDEMNFTTETVDNGQVLNRISEWIPTQIFDKKIANALESLRYDKAMRFALAFSTAWTSEGDPAEWQFPVEDIMDIDLRYTYDEFAVYCLIYGHLFSEHFLEFCIITED